MNNIKTKSLKKTLLEIVGYFSIFIIALIVFTVLKVPEEKIENKVIAKITRMSQGKAEIATFTYKPLFSGYIDALAYKVPTIAGQEGRLVFRNVKVRLPWYSLIIGNTSFQGSSDFSSGTIETSGSIKEGNDIEWNADGDAISMEFLNNVITPASFQGLIQLKANGVVSGNKLKSATAELNIGPTDVRNIVIRELTIEKILLDSTHAEIEVADDIVTVKNLEIKGNELNIIVAGTITLRKNIKLSLLDLNARLRVGPAFFKEMNLPLMNGLMVSQQNKWLTIPIKGTLGKPRADFGEVLMKSPISKF